jgi:hypothetical protein
MDVQTVHVEGHLFGQHRRTEDTEPETTQRIPAIAMALEVNDACCDTTTCDTGRHHKPEAGA